MKALMIAGPILLVGGVLGAGFMGAINIPGITPKKAVAKAMDIYAEGKEEAAPTEQAPVVETPVKAKPSEEPKVDLTKQAGLTIDEERGARELAKYWKSIETSRLLVIIETFNDKELAYVLSFMPKDKVAEILSQIEPLRAATLSKELRRLASIVKIEAV